VAWKKCKRADWSLWLLANTPRKESDKPKLCAIAFKCADRAVRVTAPLALESAGLPLEAKKLRALPEIVDEKTANAAESAARSAAESAAGNARSAAGSAAWSAWSTAWSAWSTAWSAAESAAGSAAESAARSAAWSAWSAALALTADLVRKHFPKPPRLP
jgi:hypothetical protein